VGDFPGAHEATEITPQGVRIASSRASTPVEAWPRRGFYGPIRSTRLGWTM
jgi:hypothetical protein